jgi:hypothetical protein
MIQNLGRSFGQNFEPMEALAMMDRMFPHDAEPEKLDSFILGLYRHVLSVQGANGAAPLQDAIRSTRGRPTPWLGARIAALHHAQGDLGAGMSLWIESLSQAAALHHGIVLDVISCGAPILGHPNSGDTLERMHEAIVGLEGWGTLH